jgi:hypothetical protein
VSSVQCLGMLSIDRTDEPQMPTCSFGLSTPSWFNYVLPSTNDYQESVASTPSASAGHSCSTCHGFQRRPKSYHIFINNIPIWLLLLIASSIVNFN